MQGIKRKVTYVFLYEFIALLLMTMTFQLYSDHDAASAGALGAITVLVAILWNLLYNSLFEFWESRQAQRGRGLARRTLHAAGFELGLLAITLPLFAWWLDLSLVDAFLLDAGLTLFFMCFTFVYNWSFDRIFGLPLAAQ